MPPTHLRCEYFVNPIGIDARQPRLSWQCQAAKQSAYQVVVEGAWDSGKIQSDRSIHIAYGGPALRSRQQCSWKVRVWDGDSQPSPWSEPATFEMGLLERGDWQAKWIGSHIVGGPYSIPPVPHLRKAFSIAKPVKSARLYVTALGLYEFAINGRRVGDAMFTPGRTDYTRRVPYHVYDVTGQLRHGDNSCHALLGDGWYCGHLHSDPRQTYGDRPRLLAQLHLDFGDGSAQTIATDESWEAGEGAIRSSDMLMGEDIDARFELRDWRPVVVFNEGDSHLFRADDRSISDAVRAEKVAVPLLVAHRAPPVRKIQELQPVAPPVTSKNKRRHIFDLGQNMVGWVRLRVRNAPPGKTIDLRYTEMLDREGKPYTLALRSARATDHYTTRGTKREGQAPAEPALSSSRDKTRLGGSLALPDTHGGIEEFFEPKFTFHGFRYVEVRDYPGGNPGVEDLTGVVVHSDCEPTGEFECSDPLINQLQNNILWSQRGNFLDIPTDCPQRDERAGWTGDAQVFIRTAAFNMDVANFFTKWLTDMADAQDEEGRIPSVVPHIKSFYHEGGPAWADAAVICPWTIYLCYGDEKILEQCWPMMSRFMQFLERNSKDFIRADEHWKWKGYGDWLSMNADTPSDFLGTAFYAHCAALMAKIARVLGRTDDSSKYDELFGNVRRAFVKRFLAPHGELTVSTQTAYVLALHFDLLDEPHRPAAVKSLVADIESREMHLSTGFVGTPYLNHVLTRFGRTDVAYALLMQKTYPSWLYPVTQGATTMWERWDAWTHDKGFSDTGMNSFNHYAFGAVGAWMYQTIAGIDLDEARPGYKHILFRPQPGGGLTHARATLRSMYGVIQSAWRIDAGHFHLTVTVPPNTTATVVLPDGASQDIGTGQHSFECECSFPPRPLH